MLSGSCFVTFALSDIDMNILYWNGINVGTEDIILVGWKNWAPTVSGRTNEKFRRHIHRRNA